MPEVTAEQTGVQLLTLGRSTMYVTVRGLTPLIVHKFSSKARLQMLENMQKTTRAAKVAKDPVQEYKDAAYRMADGSHGFPCVAFKAATIGAARYFDKKIVNMTMLRGALFFRGEGPEQLVRIDGDPHMREDVVTVGINGHDLRYRPEFTDWSTTLEIIYLPGVVTADSIVSLVEAGGMGGVGEWRPSKCETGSFGTYKIEDVRS